jgi:hypothetical protein
MLNMTLLCRCAPWGVGWVLGGWLILAWPAGSMAGELVDRSYAVVVSNATDADAGWHAVVAALASKHHGRVIRYSGDVERALPELRGRLPRYACFVATPAEATRGFVMSVHRLTRQLGDEPYGSVMWGIVTGATAADALRVANVSQPLIMRRAGAGTGINLSEFESGKWFSEGTPGESWTRENGGTIVRHSGPADSTKDLVDFLNEGKPDIFVTSGHASERDWRIGYSYPNGRLMVQDGKLVGQDLKKDIYPIDSPNPKVFLAVGNCLMGHVNGTNCMALGWIGSGGVDQFVGYTVVTWYGAMGWGVSNYLFDQPGRYSVAEAFYFSNQCVLHDLAKQYPKALPVNMDIPDDDVDGFQARIVKQIGPIAKADEEHEVGLLWDRDVVVMYGDPAWDARLAEPATGPHILTDLVERAGVWEFTTRADGDISLGKPLAMLLPQRVKNVEIVAGKEFEPVVTSNFIMLCNLAKLEAGKTYRVAFKANAVPIEPMAGTR